MAILFFLQVSVGSMLLNQFPITYMRYMLPHAAVVGGVCRML
jgi:hypothetical protein